MEKDDAIKGEGNSIAFNSRMYDPRVGRWLSTDPMEIKYPGFSPYNYALNNPIFFVDPDGAETKPSDAIKQYLGIDLPPMVAGLVDGAFDASFLGVVKFGYDLAADDEFRHMVLEGLKQMVSDPIGTMKTAFADQWDAFSTVLTDYDNATDEQKYTVGHTAGGTISGLITGGGVALFFKKLLKPKTKGLKSLDNIAAKPKKLPVTDKAANIGKHKDMKKITDGKQSHHLNQDAAFRDRIPTNEAQAIKLEGNAFKDINSPHFKAHKSLEQFWNTYRKGGAKAGQRPTMLEYTRALKKSLKDAGLNDADIKAAMKAAINDRVKHHLLGGDKVPRVPGRINQAKGSG